MSVARTGTISLYMGWRFEDLVIVTGRGFSDHVLQEHSLRLGVQLGRIRVMKTIGIALMGLGLGVSAVLAQIGAPVTVPVPAVPAVSVPAPAMTAPAPAATATVQPKPVKHPQRNAAQHTER